ncbi:PadR family transcriptional regulator [Leucobacter sp. W1038]|uniref:PadR family transcriptional regulator n=1 Tax=Leucobacter sp. W1038 TaxID=3438281 RepID=UPI003D95F7C6
MSLRAALLALISAGPATGYDIAKQFRSTVGHLWHAPDSQIYPELRRMQQEDLLHAEDIPWGQKHATKTQYSITPAGTEALARWQASPLTYAPERDQAHLLAAYFEWAPHPSDARQRLLDHISHFDAMRDSAQGQITAIEARTNQTLNRRLTMTDPEHHERVIAFKLFAYRGKIARAESEIAWAREGLELLDGLTPGEA